MGMNQDLRLQGNEFSNTATFFFVAYLIAELPTGKEHYWQLQVSETDTRSSHTSRLHLNQIPREQVPRNQCCAMGNSDRVYRSRQGLPDLARMSSVYRHIRSLRCAEFDAHHWSVV